MVTDNNNYIYFWGGFNTWQDQSDELWRYDIGLNSWYMLSTAPASLAYQTGAYIYPYIYFGGGGYGGNLGNNSLYKFNLINNTWTGQSTPPLGSTWDNVINESYFTYDGLLYCYTPESIANGPPKLYKLNMSLTTWSEITLTHYGGGIAHMGGGNTTYDFLTKIEPIGNGQFFVLQDGDLGNNPTNNYCTSNGGCGPGCGPNWGISGMTSSYIFMLVMGDKASHIIVDDSECFDPNTMDSLNINYRVQFTGDFNNVSFNVNLKDNLGNITLLRTVSGFYSSSQQVLSFTDKISATDINNSLEMSVDESGDTTNSINSYPISNAIIYSIFDSISASGNTNLCPGNSIGIILNVTNNNSYTYRLR